MIEQKFDQKNRDHTVERQQYKAAEQTVIDEAQISLLERGLFSLFETHQAEYEKSETNDDQREKKHDEQLIGVTQV